MKQKIESILKLCSENKISVSLASENLKIDFDEPPCAELVAVLRENKQGILDYLKVKEEQKSAPVLKPLMFAAEEVPSAVLSFGQKRLWVTEKMGHGSAQYNMLAAFKLAGELNQTKLQLAVNELVKRHTALRTVFFQDEHKKVFQKVLSEVSVPLIYQDLCDLNSDDIDSRITTIIKDHTEQEFDLQSGCLIRCTLLQTSQYEYIFVFNVHHIAADGWSLQIILAEICELYNSSVEQRPADIKPLPLQYIDYAHWQNRLVQSESMEQSLAFWQKQLANLPAIHGLPTRTVRNSTLDISGKSSSFSLDNSQVELLKTFAASQKVTFFMLVHAIYSLVLATFSNNDDIVLGVPVANRNKTEIESLVGFFANTMILRSKIDKLLSFADYIKQIKADHLAAQQHQEVPFDYLVEKTNPVRDGSYAPLVQLALTMDDNRKADTCFVGLSVELYPIPQPFARFELALNLRTTDNGVDFEFEYMDALFSKELIVGLQQSLKQVIGAVVGNPQALVKDLPIIPETQKCRLLNRQFETSTEFDRKAAINGMISLQAAANPTRTALVFDDDEISYADLEQQANTIANYLISRGVKPGDMVGLCSERSAKMVVGLLAILKTGAGYLPLDPTYPAKRIDYILQDAAVNKVLCSDKVAQFIDFPATVIQIPITEALSYNDFATIDNAVGDSLAYMIYTSGSTGLPKGVRICHRNVINFFTGMDHKLGIQEAPARWLASTSISFDISVLELFWTLSRGDTVVIQPDMPKNKAKQATKEIDFSLFYFAGQKVDDNSDVYNMLLTGAKFADQSGFSGVWVPERHFNQFGQQFPNPSVIAAAVATVTNQVAVRSGSFVLPLHDPLRVAEEWSMVDNLAKGRVELSFASGWSPDDFALAPQNYENRHQVMEDSIATVRQLWQGQSIKRVNGNGEDVDVRVYPSPIQKDLPVWVTAAHAEQTFQYAGSIGANILTHLLGQTMEELAHKIKLYREARAAAGFDPESGKVALMLHTFVNDDPQCKQLVAKPLKDYIRQSVHLVKSIAVEAEVDIDKDLEFVLDIAFERYYEHKGLFGSRQNCEAFVHSLQGMGVDEIACLIDFGLPDAVVLDSLPSLAKLQQAIKKAFARERFLQQLGGQLWTPQELILKHNITHLQCTPSYIQSWPSAEKGRQALNNLQMLLLGGEALPQSSAQALHQAVKGQIFNMYGPTETTIWSSVSEVSDQAVTIGTPISNTQFYVLDQYMCMLPEGVPGELYIGGEGVAGGYHNRQELTAERFVANPFAENALLYRTGDIVKWLQNGQLEFVGRVDEQVKVNGYRIELSEIACQLENLAMVKSAHVLVSPNDKATSELAAFIQLNDSHKDQEPTALKFQIRRALEQALPSFMNPQQLVFVTEWVTTANGKIDKKALLNSLALSRLQRTDFKAPASNVEKALATLWADILHRSGDGISKNANFFELGGNSLLVVTMIDVINEQFGTYLKVGNVFGALTIESLAQLIELETKLTSNRQLINELEKGDIEEVEF